MKRERWQELQRTGAMLEPEEMRAGWHYCNDFDQDLTRGDERGEGTKCCWCGFDGATVGDGRRSNSASEDT